MKTKLTLLNIVAYLFLLVVNILAIQIPFFGRTPGDVSDLYPHMLTPPDFTFRIWSVIYLLLGVFIFYSYKLDNGTAPQEVKAIGWLFSISSVINVAWLLAWQSLHFGWATLFILLYWIILIVINVRLTNLADARWYFKIPFSTYLAWICVASLANHNVYLIVNEFSFFGLSEAVWTVTLIAIGICGTILVLLLNGDIWFTLVLNWAFFGIYIKNNDVSASPNIVANMSLFAMIFLTAFGFYSYYRRKQRIV
jgi:hypothetical protein